MNWAYQHITIFFLSLNRIKLKFEGEYFLRKFTLHSDLLIIFVVANQIAKNNCSVNLLKKFYL